LCAIIQRRHRKRSQRLIENLTAVICDPTEIAGVLESLIAARERMMFVPTMGVQRRPAAGIGIADGTPALTGCLWAETTLAVGELSRPLDFARTSLFNCPPMNSLLIDLSPRQLRQAADLKERIESLQHDLSQMLGALAPNRAVGTPKKTKISAQGLANIRAGVRKRMAAKAAKAAIGVARGPSAK